MRSRPDVELHIPSVIHPGDLMRAEVTVHSSSPTPVSSVHAELVGTEILRFNAGRQQTRGERSVFHERVELSGATELGESSYRYDAAFQLPADAPCSYLGTRAEIQYVLHVRIAIPWWLDVHDEYEVKVRPRVTPRSEPQSVVARTNDSAALVVELSLTDQLVAGGDIVRGAFALGNLAGKRVRTANLSLVGTEVVELGGRRDQGEAHRFTVCKPLRGVFEGDEIPFHLGAPDWLPPSYSTTASSLSWAFELSIEMGLMESLALTVPLRVAAFDSHGDDEAPRLPVGSQRWRTAWGEEGARRGLALDRTVLRLSGSLAGSIVTVDLDAEDRGLRAELRGAPLGLGLRLGRHRLALSAIDTGDKGFQRRFTVRGREPAQIVALLARRLRRALLVFDEVSLDDERVRVRGRARGPAREQEALGAFLDQLTALATELTAAVARIPPPAAMAASLPAFRAFAERTSGHLDVGAMCVRGARIEEATFEVETLWTTGATPTATVLRLHAEPPLPAGFEPNDVAALAAAPPGTAEAIRSLSQDGALLRVAEHTLELELDGPLEDPEVTRPSMLALLALARRLRRDKSVGPYR